MDVLATSDFDCPLFSPDVIILFENLHQVKNLYKPRKNFLEIPRVSIMVMRVPTTKSTTEHNYLYVRFLSEIFNVFVI